MNEPDGVIRLHADPLGDRAVLALLLAKDALDAKALVGRLQGETQKKRQHMKIDSEHVIDRVDEIKRWNFNSNSMQRRRRKIDESGKTKCMRVPL
jgi:hypothetical protein